jgi:hypothetical protein
VKTFHFVSCGEIDDILGAIRSLRHCFEPRLSLSDARDAMHALRMTGRARVSTDARFTDDAAPAAELFDMGVVPVASASVEVTAAGEAVRPGLRRMLTQAFGPYVTDEDLATYAGKPEEFRMQVVGRAMDDMREAPGDAPGKEAFHDVVRGCAGDIEDVCPPPGLVRMG